MTPSSCETSTIVRNSLSVIDIFLFEFCIPINFSMPELNKFTNQITGVKTFIKSKMIGAYAIASLSALIVAHVLGVISPNTKIKKVIINVAILTAAPPKEYAINEAILAAEVFTKLLPINIALSIFD